MESHEAKEKKEEKMNDVTRIILMIGLAISIPVITICISQIICFLLLFLLAVIVVVGFFWMISPLRIRKKKKPKEVEVLENRDFLAEHIQKFRNDKK